MRTSIAVGTFLAVGAAAVGASAIDLRGSDTLEGLVDNLTQTVDANDCGGVPEGNPLPGGVVYVGTGSGNGESALVNGSQLIAPMSRALAGASTPAATGICVASAALQARAESVAFALDGLAVIGNSGNLSACNGAAQDCSTATDPTAGLAFTTAKVIAAPGYVCPAGGVDAGCVNGSYRIVDFRDALRLIYAGMDHDASNQRARRDCDVAPRVALAESWGNVFEGSCATGTCTRIQHAFRRNEESGTTDVFVALLGLPSSVLGQTAAAPSRSAFCNSVDSADVLTGPMPAAPIPLGLASNATPPNSPNNVYYSDFQDRDVIRRTCAGTFSVGWEQVCSARGDMGLVLPVWDAPTNLLAGDSAFPTVACSPGKFVNAAAPVTFPAGVPCPNGRPSVGGTCATPATAAGNPNCLNSPGNFYAPQGRVDGRVYNLHLHASNRAYVTSTRAVGAATGPVQVPTVGAFYRIHTNRSVTGATTPAFAGCTQNSATQQIGCLVGSASPCSLGFAGREATQQAGAFALKVGGIDPIDECVRNLIASPANRYPLSRKLYLNTTSDFGSGLIPATDPQGKLARCMTTRSIVDPAVIAAGFTTLDTTGALSPLSQCEDFNEQTACGQASNNNACANTTVAP